MLLKVAKKKQTARPDGIAQKFNEEFRPVKSEVVSVLGRPAKYTDEFCDRLVEHMADGFSFESFGGIISVCKDTLYDWERTHENFSYAKKIGLQKNLLYWEELGKKGIKAEIPFFNAAVYIFTMKNRHKWTDKPEILLQDKPKELENNEPQVIVQIPSNGREAKDI
jgi:hypothetical protein